MIKENRPDNKEITVRFGKRKEEEQESKQKRELFFVKRKGKIKEHSPFSNQMGNIKQ